MAAQASGEGPVTFINVFDIAAEESIDLFVAKWKERSRFTATADGFVSAEMFRAIDSATRFDRVRETAPAE
ncbi:hypothetical protein [Streptomyces sp. NPDC056296]|uniref:hypothetical protein n=1 Tax=Streptomyces sp. NPDC056296 TaxID=3345775 RepID=UPI0035D9B5FE